MIFGREFDFFDHGSILTTGFLILKRLTWYLCKKYLILFFSEILRMSINLKTHQKWGRSGYLCYNFMKYLLENIILHIKWGH